MDVRFIVAPTHTGLLLETTAGAGGGLTTTIVVALALGHPPTVIVSE